MDPVLFPEIPDDLTALSVDELVALIDGLSEAIGRVKEDPKSFVSADRSSEALLAEMRAAVGALKAARAELAAREEMETVEPEDGTAEAETAEVEGEKDEPEPEPEKQSDDNLAAEIAELAAEAEPEQELVTRDDLTEFGAQLAAGIAAGMAEALKGIVPVGVEDKELPETAIVASAKDLRGRLPKPGPDRRPVKSEPSVALTASAGGLGFDIGEAIPNEQALAEMMTRRRADFGNIPDGTKGEKVTLARADWRSRYPDDRVLSKSQADTALIAAATDMALIKENFQRRRAEQLSLQASGGLCAPVTPYYELAMISIADRPVRAALPAFNADRGGINYARPAALSAITTGVGSKTAANDKLGGTFATKTCQVVSCPPFQETDVAIIYHCLQFGNLGARTFPERVAQWNSLVLAAQARLAETALLTAMDSAATQITAGSLGLGASADLFSQILAAANSMRNRNRMDPEAVLRLMMPDWGVDLIVSDIIRGQFQRFDTDEDRVTALLRSFDIEPTYYIDGATGAGQVFGTQAAGPLLTFPPMIEWFLYPEGSFLFLDGGTLELGLVRDSVLNSTNDFQIFGETFENVAFVGVEAYSVESQVCDSGTVSLPKALNCGYSYAGTT